LSPLLFNIYIQYVINEPLEDIQEGVKVGGVLIPAIRFTYNQAMVSHTVRGLQVIMDARQDTSVKYNMRTNMKKTKIMRMSTVEERTMKITVNGQNLERVKQFCYLGSLVIEDCRRSHEVRRRIALGKEAFNKKSDLMRGSLSLHLKKRMMKAFVWSVALYGSETWTLQKEDIRLLEAFEIWIWRRVMKVPWTEHKTNEDILQMVETEREILDTVRSRQKRWLGHILRHDSLLRITLEGQTQGKKAYGDQEQCFWIVY